MAFAGDTLANHSCWDLWMRLLKVWREAARWMSSSWTFQKHSTKCVTTSLSTYFSTTDYQGRSNSGYSTARLTGDSLHWLGGSRSEFAPVESGVPQGSVLGPTLFLLYINDMLKALCPEYVLFSSLADDTVCQRDVTSETDQCQLQQDLDSLAIWEGKWKMSFHPQKCSTLQMSLRRKIAAGSYSLHNHQLQNVTSAMYLGVEISSDLRWDSHIVEVTSRANRTLDFVRRNLRICSRKTKASAYTKLW